jgi:hypothetical protein
MLQALTTPALKSVLLGGIVLGMGLFAGHRDHAVTHRLALHAVDEPNSFYLTAWRDGDVKVQFDTAELREITFKVRASVYDGCEWLGTETLVPIDSRTFAYDYRETILSCEPGATPLRKTPRTGTVTVDD